MRTSHTVTWAVLVGILVGAVLLAGVREQRPATTSEDAPAALVRHGAHDVGAGRSLQTAHGS